MGVSFRRRSTRQALADSQASASVAVLEAPAVVACLDDVAVVREPVE